MVIGLLLGYISDKREEFKSSKIENQSSGKKSQSDQQKKSLFYLASKFNCDPSKIKENYLSYFKENQFSLDEIREARDHLRQNKIKESVAMNIDINNTPASFLEKWTSEHINELTKKEVSKDDSIQKIINDNPELKKLLDKDVDLGEIKEFLNKNQNLLNSVWNERENAIEESPISEENQKEMDVWLSENYEGEIDLIEIHKTVMEKRAEFLEVLHKEDPFAHINFMPLTHYYKEEIINQYGN